MTATTTSFLAGLTVCFGLALRQVSERTVRNTIAQVRVFARAVPINPTLLMAADQMENMLDELIERRKK